MGRPEQGCVLGAEVIAATSDVVPAAVQLDFLNRLQRLLQEGLFVATYKFALLNAIADLAVTNGDDTGAPLVLSTTQIAEKFIELVPTPE